MKCRWKVDAHLSVNQPQAGTPDIPHIWLHDGEVLGKTPHGNDPYRYCTVRMTVEERWA